ncbi:MAG TPA: hypothetical protein VK671_05580 [Mucilaginibacter sp.]|nr:hypothetical protein [Mucilaginibacter sp.]
MKRKIVSMVLLSALLGIICTSCSRKCYCSPTPAKPTPRVIMPS